jgi:hypothetical protein
MYRHFLFLVWVVWVWIFLPTDDEAETWFEKQTGSGSVSKRQREAAAVE